MDVLSSNCIPLPGSAPEPLEREGPEGSPSKGGPLLHEISIGGEKEKPHGGKKCEVKCM